LITSCLKCNSKRQNKILPRAEVSRLKKKASKPLNRDLGKLYAGLVRAVRKLNQIHPLTLRKIESPKKGLQLNMGRQWSKYNYLEGY
jgi:hypothetical protein